MRVLLLEDDDRVAETVERGLRASGHDVVAAATLQNANEALSKLPLDAAVVDVSLPDGSGLDFCRAVRESGFDFPIVVLTAHNTVRERVAGLDSGADDYLGKPFSMEELLARLRALARRGPRFAESRRRFGELVIDRDRRQVLYGEHRIPLTARELDIVALLAWRDGRIVARDEILEAVWGDVSERASRSFDVLVTRIRRKLGEQGVVDAIRTERNVGYAWGLERSKHD